jgi:hypothetical protein
MCFCHATVLVMAVCPYIFGVCIHAINLAVPTSRQGSIRLFQFSGINVFLHWSWFLIAAYEIQVRAGQ